MYKVSVTPVVGLPQFAGWSQVTTQSSATGELVVAFAVAGEHAGNVGRDLNEVLSKSSVADAFSLNQLIEDLVAQAHEMDCTVQVAASYFVEGRAVLGVYNGTIFLKRGEKSGKVLTADTMIKIVEGKYLPTDVVVLTTQQATTYLDEVAQKFIRGFELDSVITSIIPGLHAEEDSSLSALGFVTGGQEVVLEEAPVAADWSQPAPEEHEKNADELDGELEVDEFTDVEEPVIGVISEESSTTPEMESVQADEASVLVETPELLANDGSAEPVLLDSPSPDTTLPKTAPSRVSRRWWLHLQQQGELVHSRLGGHKPEAAKVVGAVGSSLRAGLLAAGTRLKLWLAALLVLLVKLPSLFAALIERLGHLRTPHVSTWQNQVGSPEVFVTPTSPRQLLRKFLPLIAVVVVVVGVGGFFFYRNLTQVQAAQSALQPLQSKLSSAQTQASSDPIPARESVMSVIGELESLKQTYQGKKAAVKLVDAELASARSLYDDISGKEEFSELAIFYDTRLLSSDFIIGTADSNGRHALFLDSGKKTAIILNLESKEAKQVTLDVADLKDVAVTENNALFLGNGVRRVSLTKDEPVQTILEEGDSNRNATLLEGFGEYMYMFNPEKRNIFRYAPQGDGFSDPIGWLRGVAGLEFERVTSMNIDGDLWLGTNDGHILKYAGGRPQEFAVKGLSEPFSSKIVLYTKENLKNVYVLEADKHRLVVLTKEGEFLREVKSTSLASATTIVVSEEQQRALAISGSIVFEVGL